MRVCVYYKKKKYERKFLHRWLKLQIEPGSYLMVICDEDRD